MSPTNQRCKTCYTGFYYDLTRESCYPLNPLCRTVDSQNNCLTCYMGYLLRGGSCLIDNAQNLPSFSKGSQSGQVGTSGQGSSGQGEDKNCQKYKEGSALCEVCANRYYLSKGVCTQVDPTCKTWDTMRGHCTSCYSGYTCGENEFSCRPAATPAVNSSDPNSFKKYCIKYRNGVCAGCSYRFYLSFGFCLPVSDLCNTFNPTFGYCLSCYDGYTLDNGICDKK